MDEIVLRRESRRPLLRKVAPLPASLYGLPMRRRVCIFPTILLLSAGCGADTDRPAATTNPAAGSSGYSPPTATDASVDGGPEAGSDHCIAGTFLFDKDSGFGGNLEIAGTFEAAATVSSGRLVVVTLETAVGGPTTTVSLNLSAPGTTFRFRITGLAKGSYVLRAQADVTGTTAVGETGDLDGYYDGAAASPIFVRANAAPITLEDACVDKIAFGIGVTL